MTEKSESSPKADALKLRQITLSVIEKTQRGSALSGQLIEATRKDMSKRDAAFVRELAYQYFRHLGSVRRVMRKYIERPIPDKARAVSRILELGLVQLLYMKTDDHAAVDQTVELVARRKHPAEQAMKGLANAVMRRVIREREDTLAFIDRDPASDLAPWLKTSWGEQFGGKALDALGQAITITPSIDLTPKNADDAKAIAKAVNGIVMPTGSIRLKENTDVQLLQGFRSGDWWVQDMAAAIPATLLGNIKGKRVADVCAAPGGKTMQLAAQGAEVIALDHSKRRMTRLYENLKRTGLADKVETVVDDASSWIPREPLDHVLLDAPCSATGTLRRNPDGPWSKGPRDVKQLQKIQREILEHVWALVPVGGRLIYCVCSLQKEEGVDQITHFIEKHENAKLVPIRSKDVGGLNKLVTPEGYLLTRPDHLAKKGGMDGFFAARIERTG